MVALDLLTEGLAHEHLQGPRTCPILGVTPDSRKILAGWAFVAVQGARADGLDYVAEALARGAVALVIDRPLTRPIPPHIACLSVADARRALSHMAAAFYGYPTQTLCLIGV